jgi:putative tricarboxylic transport membrane protein
MRGKIKALSFGVYFIGRWELLDTRVKELLSALAFLVISIILYLATLNIKSMTSMGVGPDFAPKLVAIGMFILSVILLIKEIRNWKLTRNNDSSHSKAEKDVSVNQSYKKKYKNALLTTVLIALYIFAIPIVGFLISTILYLMIQFCFLGERKYWNKPLFFILSLIVSAAVYFTFRLAFEVRLPAGVLF